MRTAPSWQSKAGGNPYPEWLAPTATEERWVERANMHVNVFSMFFFILLYLKRLLQQHKYISGSWNGNDVNVWKAQAIKLYLVLPLTRNHPNRQKFAPWHEELHTTRSSGAGWFFSCTEIWTLIVNAVAFLLGAKRSEEQKVTSVGQEEWLARTASLS